ncbi:MAG: hypothetical protein WA194_06455 [Patescibacteria group bacterium]
MKNPSSASLTGAIVDENSAIVPSGPPNPCPGSVENASANNMLYCRWSSNMTWASAATSTPSGYHICKVSEYYARYAGFPVHTGNGYLWGNALAAYWGESAGDVGTYACTEPNGTCHSNEHGKPYGTSTGHAYGDAGCANNAWVAASYCSSASFPSAYYCK